MFVVDTKGEVGTGHHLTVIKAHKLKTFCRTGHLFGKFLVAYGDLAAIFVIESRFGTDPFVIDIKLDIPILLNASRFTFKKELARKGIEDLVGNKESVVETEFAQAFDMRESDCITERFAQVAALLLLQGIKSLNDDKIKTLKQFRPKGVKKFDDIRDEIAVMCADLTDGGVSA